MKSEKVLSCIQPSGSIHFGNYFGAIANWVSLQSRYPCVFGIADLHCLTQPLSPLALRSNIVTMMLDLIACGIDPGNLFIQSMIPEHTELAWIFNCITPFGELRKQVQFKEKSADAGRNEDGKIINAGLLTYPVLQAADILIYRADLVPVGKDQEQHLELSRTIALRFNNFTGVAYFNEPRALFTEIPKVMSLADPSKKMSKSLGEKHFIGLFEDESSIRRKVMQAVTANDTNAEKMPAGIANLFTLLAACGAKSEHFQLMNDYCAGQLKYQQLKDVLAGVLIRITSQFRRTRASLAANEDLVEKRVVNSTIVVRQQAQRTLADVKRLTGLLPKLEFNN